MPKQPELTFGPLTLRIDRQLFTDAGPYRLRAALYRKADGKQIDRVTRIIFVEKDPEFRTPFEVQAQERFPEHMALRQWYATFEDGNPLLYYNLSHPYYDRVKEDPRFYLFEVFLEGAMAFLLSRPPDDQGKPNYAPLDSARIGGDPRDAYDEIIAKIAEVRGRFYVEN